MTRTYQKIKTATNALQNPQKKKFTFKEIRMLYKTSHKILMAVFFLFSIVLLTVGTYSLFRDVPQWLLYGSGFFSSLLALAIARTPMSATVNPLVHKQLNKTKDKKHKEFVERIVAILKENQVFSLEAIQELQLEARNTITQIEKASQPSVVSTKISEILIWVPMLTIIGAVINQSNLDFVLVLSLVLWGIAIVLLISLFAQLYRSLQARLNEVADHQQTIDCLQEAKYSLYRQKHNSPSQNLLYP